MKNAKYIDFEDLVYRLQLTYDEIIDILGLNYIPTKRTGYSLNPGIYEVVYLKNTLYYSLLDNVKVGVTIDDLKLKSNLKIIQTIIFIEKSFFTILGFNRSRFYPLDDIDGLYQLIAGSHKSDRTINITGNDNFLKGRLNKKKHSQRYSRTNFYSFALSSPPGRKIYTEP